MEQNVQIVELNAENWYDCCELEVSPEQKNSWNPMRSQSPNQSLSLL